MPFHPEFLAFMREVTQGCNSRFFHSLPNNAESFYLISQNVWRPRPPLQKVCTVSRLVRRQVHPKLTHSS
jgi:hypothetical protein